MGKVTTSRAKKQRHDPLVKDLKEAEGRLKKVRKDEGDDNTNGEEFIDDKASRKILQLAKAQQEEIEEENEKESQDAKFQNARFKVITYDNDDEEEEEEEEDFGENISDFEPEDGEYVEEEEVVEIDEEDAAMFEQYFKKADDFNSLNGSYNLADKIMASIREKEMELSNRGMDEDDNEGGFAEPAPRVQEGVELPEKVIRAYTTVGSILKTWTHGKLPKLFKVIPSLKNWQDVLYVTNPEEWSPHIVYEATKLFVSNLQAKEAQKFINMVLLDRFRENIETTPDHSLNYHIYRAIKKSLYKPSAFFKGFLFPLVESGCNIREATIAGSVLAKVSVPVLHSSAALSYLLRLPFTPATTVFIKILLDKKYALPYQTVDDCVYYFMRFRILDDGSNGDDATRTLPVIWHKAFLVFAQRYKNDITQDQRDFLIETVRQRGHRDIGPEIRRELLAGSSREFDSEQPPKDDIMVDVR
ncbi:Essential nuclear protein 1 [Nakaseomyces glabratus]|uniref:Essential nuclear protein 1 n=1 Tax=Candida glabrata TaxID=5478 RepID=A0A0W0DSQ5_CANGB|nr:Essential nuclear protein 1 [Nakaseomyces glabratus]KTA99059.1 Essential nuclear protein 1 [Nakaseomyces glabratus]KTA99555.1 Essential nuclear protein 1 [Nakaseomyces glabratus]KTB14631.1 Essential nuclear protein 1 [Nakaseomyces glabratus]